MWSGQQDHEHTSGSEDTHLSLAEQMDGMALDDTSETTISDDSSFRFGKAEDFTFDFTPTSTATWPGPAYDEKARFAPGVFDEPRKSRPRSKLRSPKRKLSQHDNSQSLRSTKPPQDKGSSEHSKQKTISRPIQYYGSPPPRDEPLHLLTLPGEIRNHIYNLLTVSRSPLIAQFKPIIRPHKGHTNGIVVRRFPREPTLALGNRQLRDEVLSTFYSKNKFLIRQTDNVDLKSHSLFLPEELQNWTPKWNMAASLMYIEVHFNARLLVGGKQTSEFVLRRSADGELRLTHRTEIEEYCMCFDQRMGRHLSALYEVKARPSGDLVYEIGGLIRRRGKQLEADEGMQGNGNKFRPKGLDCVDCGKAHLRMLENGL
ncbi:hypothetical protein LTR09_007573 [Extremus antarcticus]|uniref:Uncharacterized protein n=1 Tax=Extremus antarcticus TaxID=702011 RepID=A0AAJ0GCV0_9PEZI|nr:hypothetical protein LTR09_007573 [Extremus antarcticus]